MISEQDEHDIVELAGIREHLHEVCETLIEIHVLREIDGISVFQIRIFLPDSGEIFSSDTGRSFRIIWLMAGIGNPVCHPWILILCIDPFQHIHDFRVTCFIFNPDPIAVVELLIAEIQHRDCTVVVGRVVIMIGICLVACLREHPWQSRDIGIGRIRVADCMTLAGRNQRSICHEFRIAGRTRQSRSIESLNPDSFGIHLPQSRSQLLVQRSIVEGFCLDEERILSGKDSGMIIWSLFFPL